MNFNQLTIIGFIGKNAETKQVTNGTPVIKLLDDAFVEGRKGKWKDRTQWHNAGRFGQGFAQLTPRLVKGAHVFGQGELTTRGYDRFIMVPNGKKSIEHMIQQLAVELKADPVRLLDLTANAESVSAAQSSADQVAPYKGRLVWCRLRLATPGSVLAFVTQLPARLSALSGALAFLLRANRCPIVSRDLSHRPAKDF